MRFPSFLVVSLVLSTAACATGLSATGDDGEGDEGAGGGAATAGAAGDAGAAGAAAGSGGASAGASGGGSGGASAGKGGAAAGTGGKGGGAGTGGAAAGAGGAAGTGGAAAGTGGAAAGAGGAAAGSGGAAAGTGGAAAGTGGGASGSSGQGGATSACATALAALSFGFDAGDQGFTHAIMDGASAPSWPIDQWERGAPSGGPGSCHGGNACWGTNLGGNYAACGRAMLRSPAMNVAACSGTSLKLVFWHWYDFLSYTVSGTSYADGGVVELSGDGGKTWTPAGAGSATVSINPAIGGAQCVKASSFYVDGKAGFVGASGTWQMVEITVPSSLVTSSLAVRFAYASGVNYESTDAQTTMTKKRPGWYVDDVAVVAQ